MTQGRQRPPKKEESAPSEQFPIVGIGASAGGLEALTALLSHMPADNDIVFVVIQHLDPKHKSIMVSLLAHHTPKQVLPIKDGMKIEKNRVYLNPPNRYVGLLNQKLILDKPEKRGDVRLPIDFFFRALSDDLGDKAICIILSGTGTDGTLGLKAIKAGGGMAMAQEEAQAAYPGMPGSAIGTGLVDIISPVEEMGNKLLQYLRHPLVSFSKKTSTDKGSFSVFIQKILFLIRTKTGNDYSKYKQNTIYRRIERRMAVHHIDKIQNYYQYVQQNPLEVDMLEKDLLIGVTRFFRDSKAFAVIGDKVLPEIFAKKKDDEPVRIWVPGCASGEEAYSLAILALETMERTASHLNIQIFGTDIDAAAIECARTAVYPNNIAADVSARRLERFFHTDGNTFRIKKQIRDMLIFAVQNLIKDPPFSKLDLVSCRNLLIYMGAELQRKIMPLIHYTLVPQGYLFLGSSESIGGFADLFSAADTKWKIFQRKGDISDTRNHFTIPPFQEHGSGTKQVSPAVPPLPASLKGIGEKIIMDEYAPAGVLVDDKLEILYFTGQTGSYLMQPTGEPSRNILKLARKELHYRLDKALMHAVKQKRMISTKDIQIKTGDGFKTIQIVVRPVTDPAAPQGLLLVVFNELSSPIPLSTETKTKTDAGESEKRIGQMEKELRYTRESLQTTIEELETSNEELKSTNEEPQSTNEELQSTNEELETSKEEMHSTNEELITVNAELQSKVKELEETNNDISNLLSSTEIATLFLDNDLCIKRFTPAATKLFNLIPTDIGRPIGDITTQFNYEGLQNDCKSIFDKLVPQEAEIQTKNQGWIIMRLAPYRTVENIIDGVVITFQDITKEKKAMQAAELARVFAENIVDTVREPLVVLDEAMRVLSANRSFYSTFQVDRDATELRLLFELGDGQWNLPQLKKQLKEILPKKMAFENFRVDHDFPGIGRRSMLLNGRQLINQAVDGSSMILLAIEDITDHQNK